MADLSVNICGVDFKNPVIPASGVFGYGREYEELFPLEKLGGIATKGTTLNLRKGNLPPRIAETPSGMQAQRLTSALKQLKNLTEQMFI